MLVCTFLCPFLHDYDVNKQTTTKFSGSLFLNLAMVPSNSTPGGLHLTRGTSVGIIPIKSERTQIHFIRDVLVAVASYVLWGDNDVSLDWWYNIIIYDELPRKKKLARILDKSEISVEPFKLNKCPRASFRSSTVSYFFLFVQKEVCICLFTLITWFFLAASPLVSSAFGRRNEAPRRTRE